jgi:HAMP domain-containing protein
MSRETGQQAEGADAMAEQVASGVLAGLVQELRHAKWIGTLVDSLDGLAKRLDEMERQTDHSGLRARIGELERELAELKQQREASPAEPPPVRAKVPIAPPANTSLANVPFGLSADPVRRSPLRRVRNRNPMRPTVVYRTDPRSAPAAKSQTARAPSPLPAEALIKPPVAAEPVQAPEADEAVGACSEPGCDRPVRCRGLCAAHYQRLRHKERKIEVKQANDGPFPPPPPPRRPAVQAARREGGTRGVFALLYEEKGRRILAGLINQLKFDRIDLVERLNQQLAGMPGVPLEVEDALRAIHYHKLGEALKTREGEVICRHLRKQRGSLVKTAQKMKLTIEQLQQRVDELDLIDQVTQVRQTFREQILEHSSFSERLDLALTREKYLKDLDIESEVDASLRAELDGQLAKLADGAAPDETEAAIRSALALDEQRYRRLLRRFGLEERLGEAVPKEVIEGSAP